MRAIKRSWDSKPITQRFLAVEGLCLIVSVLIWDRDPGVVVVEPARGDDADLGLRLLAVDEADVA